MKKTFHLTSIILGITAFLAACKNDTDFVLKGKLGTEKGEYILAVYDDPIAKIDTIMPVKGKFEYYFTPDTFTLIRLVDKEGHEIPIFADKGWKVDCKGTFSSPEIEGNGPNNDYQDFHNSVKGEKIGSEKFIQKAKEFIFSHPQSFASAYLIDRYFIQVPHPNIETINALIAPLHGNIKDSHIISVATKSIPVKKDQDQTYLGYFSVKNRTDKYLTWKNDQGDYILINYWASWNAKSVRQCKSLKELLKKLPKGGVKVMNISLDYDKGAWSAACEKDAENWIEICSFDGWETPIVKENDILALPANILVNNQRKILGKNLKEEALADIVDPKSK